MSRIKLTKANITTRSHAEAALGEIANLTIARNREALAMDEALTEIRQRHEGPIAALNKQITEKVELLENWAAENGEEFGKLKSLEMQHGTLGWRQSTKLKTLAKWTWDRVLEKLVDLSNRAFIREKLEVNKDAIRDCAMNGELDAEALKTIGCRLDVQDTFFVEPKLQEQDNRVISEVAP